MSTKFSPLERLKNKLAVFSDCAVITSDINRRYFTGMKSSAGTLVAFPDKAYLIIDFRYIEKARKTVSDCEVTLQDKLFEQINALIAKHSAKKVSVESAVMTLAELAGFRENIKCEIDDTSALSNAVEEIRITKTDEEIEKIISAQRIAEKGFEHMLGFIHEGLTEREIQLELDYFMLKNGAEALSFDTIALSGKNTSLPHGVPSDKKVQKGEFVLMDFGAVVEGYHSDMTRTVCVGQPDEVMTKVYNIVLKAQKTALDGLKAGIKCSDFDKLARDVIAAEGYGEYFGHSLGHGVGMEIHEAPTASPRSEQIFSENEIITIEPGIYLPDKFGVRIEDFAVVRNDGYFNMTNAPKELICL
ncbi:MAG: aminopeptidase P family protein [Oscillospiraceae bacterium]